MRRVLRHADPERDGEACARVYRPYVENATYSFEAKPPDGAEMAGRIESVGAEHAWLVGEVDGRVAGFTYASPHRAREAYRWTCEVSVYIDPEHHRRGLGRALYQALFELLRRQGMHVALAGIALPNEASIGLHEAFGFQFVGVYREIAWKCGRWLDCGWWQLVLRHAGDGEPPDPLGPQRLEPSWTIR